MPSEFLNKLTEAKKQIAVILGDPAAEKVAKSNALYSDFSRWFETVQKQNLTAEELKEIFREDTHGLCTLGLLQNVAIQNILAADDELTEDEKKLSPKKQLRARFKKSKNLKDVETQISAHFAALQGDQNWRALRDQGFSRPFANFVQANRLECMAPNKHGYDNSWFRDLVYWRGPVGWVARWLRGNLYDKVIHGFYISRQPTVRMLGEIAGRVNAENKKIAGKKKSAEAEPAKQVKHLLVISIQDPTEGYDEKGRPKEFRDSQLLTSETFPDDGSPHDLAGVKVTRKVLAVRDHCFHNSKTGANVTVKEYLDLICDPQVAGHVLNARENCEYAVVVHCCGGNARSVATLASILGFYDPSLLEPIGLLDQAFGAIHSKREKAKRFEKLEADQRDVVIRAYFYVLANADVLKGKALLLRGRFNTADNDSIPRLLKWYLENADLNATYADGESGPANPKSGGDFLAVIQGLSAESAKIKEVFQQLLFAKEKVRLNAKGLAQLGQLLKDYPADQKIRDAIADAARAQTPDVIAQNLKAYLEDSRLSDAERANTDFLQLQILASLRDGKLPQVVHQLLFAEKKSGRLTEVGWERLKKLCHSAGLQAEVVRREALSAIGKSLQEVMACPVSDPQLIAARLKMDRDTYLESELIVNRLKTYLDLLDHGDLAQLEIQQQFISIVTEIAKRGGYTVGSALQPCLKNFCARTGFDQKTIETLWARYNSATYSFNFGENAELNATSLLGYLEEAPAGQEHGRNVLDAIHLLITNEWLENTMARLVQLTFFSVEEKCSLDALCRIDPENQDYANAIAHLRAAVVRFVHHWDPEFLKELPARQKATCLQKYAEYLKNGIETDSCNRTAIAKNLKFYLENFGNDENVTPSIKNIFTAVVQKSNQPNESGAKRASLLEETLDQLLFSDNGLNPAGMQAFERMFFINDNEVRVAASKMFMELSNRRDIGRLTQQFKWYLQAVDVRDNDVVQDAHFSEFQKVVQELSARSVLVDILGQLLNLGAPNSLTPEELVKLSKISIVVETLDTNVQMLEGRFNVQRLIDQQVPDAYIKGCLALLVSNREKLSELENDASKMAHLLKVYLEHVEIKRNDGPELHRDFLTVLSNVRDFQQVLGRLLLSPDSNERLSDVGMQRFGELRSLHEVANTQYAGVIAALKLNAREVVESATADRIMEMPQVIAQQLRWYLQDTTDNLLVDFPGQTANADFLKILKSLYAKNILITILTHSSLSSDELARLKEKCVTVLQNATKDTDAQTLKIMVDCILYIDHANPIYNSLARLALLMAAGKQLTLVDAFTTLNQAYDLAHKFGENEPEVASGQEGNATAVVREYFASLKNSQPRRETLTRSDPVIIAQNLKWYLENINQDADHAGFLQVIKDLQAPASVLESVPQLQGLSSSPSQLSQVLTQLLFSDNLDVRLNDNGIKMLLQLCNSSGQGSINDLYEAVLNVASTALEKTSVDSRRGSNVWQALFTDVSKLVGGNDEANEQRATQLLQNGGMIRVFSGHEKVQVVVEPVQRVPNLEAGVVPSAAGRAVMGLLDVANEKYMLVAFQKFEQQADGQSAPNEAQKEQLIKLAQGKDYSLVVLDRGNNRMYRVSSKGGNLCMNEDESLPLKADDFTAAPGVLQQRTVRLPQVELTREQL